MWNRALDNRPERSYTSPLLWRRQISVFFLNPPIFYYQYFISSLMPFHSFRLASLLLKEYFALPTLTLFLYNFNRQILKMWKIYRRSIRSPLSFLVSSVVNLSYFNVISCFYSKNPFNILVALFSILSKVLIFLKVWSPFLYAIFKWAVESTIVSRYDKDAAPR